MNKREGCVLTAYVGIHLANSFADFHAYAETLLGRPIMTHEFADARVIRELKMRSEPEFMDIMRSQVQQTCEWHYDDNEWTGHWEGACGIAWVLDDGTPTDHEMSYCPKCGKRISLAGGKEATK